MGRLLLVVALIVLLVPLGAAEDDPLNEPVCDEATGCVGVGTCVEGACVPSPCEPGAECASDVGGTRSECVTNASIDGQTCSTSASAGIGTRRQTSAPIVGALGENGLVISVVATDGHVFAHNLPNSWLSPSAQVGGVVAAQSLGQTGLSVYRSDIGVEGQGPLPDTLVTNSTHKFSQLAVEAHQDGGAAGTHHLVIGLILLDYAPETCFVRSSTGAIRDVTCPRVSGLA